MQRVIDRCRLLAPHPDPVLLIGERETGKTELAALLHSASGRPGCLVGTTAAELPPSLAQSMLFGHVKGAFTGAHDHVRVW